MARLHAEEMPDRAFERHAFARPIATGVQHVDRDQRRQQTGDRIGDRHASEPRRVVARRPTAATLGADPVSRADPRARTRRDGRREAADRRARCSRARAVWCHRRGAATCSSSSRTASRDDRSERSSASSSEPRISSSRNGNGSGRPGWVTRTTCAPSSASARPVRGAAHVEPSTTTRAPSRRRSRRRASAPAVPPRAHGAPPRPGASRRPPRHRPPRPRAARRAQRPATPPSLEVGPGRGRARVHPAVGGVQQKRWRASRPAAATSAPAGAAGVPSASHSSSAHAARDGARPVARLTTALIRPRTPARRFSKKAAMPSAGRVVESNRFRSDSSRCPSAIVRSRPGGWPRVLPLARWRAGRESLGELRGRTPRRRRGPRCRFARVASASIAHRSRACATPARRRRLA